MGPAKEYVLSNLRRSNVVDDLIDMKLSITSSALDTLSDMDITQLTSLGFRNFESLVDHLWTGRSLFEFIDLHDYKCLDVLL